MGRRRKRRTPGAGFATGCSLQPTKTCRVSFRGSPSGRSVDSRAVDHQTCNLCLHFIFLVRMPVRFLSFSGVELSAWCKAESRSSGSMFDFLGERTPRRHTEVLRPCCLTFLPRLAGGELRFNIGEPVWLQATQIWKDSSDDLPHDSRCVNCSGLCSQRR